MSLVVANLTTLLVLLPMILVDQIIKEPKHVPGEPPTIPTAETPIYEHQPIFNQSYSPDVVQNITTAYSYQLKSLTSVETPAIVTEDATDLVIIRHSVYMSAFCRCITFMLAFASCCTILNSVMIGIDRYIAIIDALRYHDRITHPRIKGIVSFIWIVSFVSGILHAIKQPLNLPFNCCKHDAHSPEHNYIISISCISLFFIFPLIIKIVLYVNIYIAAHQNVKRCRHQGREPTRKSFRNERTPRYPRSRTPNRPSPGNSGSTTPRIKNSFTNSFRELKNNFMKAGHVFYREEGKTAKFAIYIIATFIICWIQHFGYGFARLFLIFPPNLCHLLDLTFIFIFSVVSPYLYAFHRRKIKKDLIKLLTGNDDTEYYQHTRSLKVRTLERSSSINNGFRARNNAIKLRKKSRSIQGLVPNNNNNTNKNIQKHVTLTFLTPGTSRNSSQRTETSKLSNDECL